MAENNTEVPSTEVKPLSENAEESAPLAEDRPKEEASPTAPTEDKVTTPLTEDGPKENVEEATPTAPPAEDEKTALITPLLDDGPKENVEEATPTAPPAEDEKTALITPLSEDGPKENVEEATPTAPPAEDEKTAPLSEDGPKEKATPTAPPAEDKPTEKTTPIAPAVDDTPKETDSPAAVEDTPKEIDSAPAPEEAKPVSGDNDLVKSGSKGSVKSGGKGSVVKSGSKGSVKSGDKGVGKSKSKTSTKSGSTQSSVKSGDGATKVVFKPPSDEKLKKEAEKEDTEISKQISGAAGGARGSTSGEGTSEGLLMRPRSRSRTSDPKLGVDLAFGPAKLQDLEPLTVGQLFKKTVKQIPDGVALKFKVDDHWSEVSYTEYYNMVIKAAKSFIKLGVEDYHGVCILGFNSAEWVIANLGAMFAGALPAGIYTTNSPEACHFVANGCKANVIVVENKMQLDKILQVRDQLPYLKAIVQYRGKLSGVHENVYDWEHFMELGKELDTSVVENKIAGQQPHQCALLIYTSGTTGAPKAVMLSHDNLTWTANCLREAYGKLEFGSEHTVSYLPLSHMAAQMADIYLTITIGGTVHFADPDALKGSLVATLKEAQPTIFFGVPRVYEKFMEGIQEKSSHVKGLKKKVGKWAAKKGIKGNYRRQSSGSLPMGWSLADKLVFKKVKEALGFQRCKIFVVGSAPTRQEVHEFFMSYDMPLMELYGMSESSGPQTFNVDTEGKWRTGSCGPLVPGAHLKIHNPDKHEEGEICYYGRHVFMGYLNNEEKTMEAIDDDGWLHSGDIGKVDKDGFLYITGRIKELIITSGGENIAPVPIENRIKTEVPFLSNVFIIGDKRKYLSCLVTLLTETDPETGEPTDDLSPVALHYIENLGSHNTTVSGIRDPKDIGVYDTIQEGVKRANLHATSNAQRVQKFAVLPKDFSIAGGELGPTLKVRRAKVLEKHATIIESMYTVTYLYAVVKKE